MSENYERITLDEDTVQRLMMLYQEMDDDPENVDVQTFNGYEILDIVKEILGM